MRCCVAYGRLPWRSSERKRAYARSTAGEPGEHADEVRELTAAGERALQDRDAALGSGELVVDLEPALLGLHHCFTFCVRLTARKCRTKRSDRHSNRAVRRAARLGSRRLTPRRIRRARSRRPPPPGRGPSRKAHRAIRSGCASWLSTTRAPAARRPGPAGDRDGARSAAGVPVGARSKRRGASRGSSVGAAAIRAAWRLVGSRLVGALEAARAALGLPRSCAPTGAAPLRDSSPAGHPHAGCGHRLSASALFRLACGVS